MAQDLQAVGIQPPDPSQDPASILRGLSQGPAAQAAQNPMMGLAAGLAGFNAGFHGQPNPVVQQVYQADDANRRNQVAQFEILNAVQRQRRQFVQDQRQVALDLLGTKSPAARRMGAQLMADGMEQGGVKLPPGFRESLASVDLDLEKRKQIYTAIRANQSVSDDYLVNQLGAPLEMVPQLRLEARSDEAHKMLFGRTPQQDALAIAKDHRAQLEYERQILRDEIKDLKDERKEKRDDTKIAQTERRLADMEYRTRQSQTRLEYLMASGPEEKRQKALDHLSHFVDKMEATAVELDRDGFLPRGRTGVVGGLLTGDPSAAAAKANRAMFPNDPSWVLFTKHLKQDIVGYSRTAQNDIGPRSIMAFQSALSLMDDPPSMDAIKKVTNTMRQAIQLSRDGKDTSQFVLIRTADGRTVKAPWKRGMTIQPGDYVVGVE